MTGVDAILNRLGVRPAERGLFLAAGACLIAMGAAGLAIQNTAEALFLKRVGVEVMPLALMTSSGLLVLTTASVGMLAARDPARWLPRILTGLAIAPLVFAPFVHSQSPLVFGALVLIARQILALGMLAFWLAMGTFVPARRAKQLFAPLAAGVTLGGIVGSFGAEPLSTLVGVDGLLAAGGGALVVAALLARRLRRSGGRSLEQAVARPAASTEVASPPGFTTLLRESRLFRLLGVALLCGGALSPVFYFLFTTVLDAATQGPGGERQMLALYSSFRGWVNVVMLLSQLWLSARLYRLLGLPLSLSLWPAAYVLGFTWIGIDFTMAAALIGFGAARVTEDGTSASAIRVLYNLFPDAVRAHASGLLEGPVNRVGGMLGNGLVLAAVALGMSAWVGWAALPVAVLWLASSFVLWRAYPGLLLRASAEHGLIGAGSDRAVLLDTATLRSLASGLVDPDPRLCAAAVDLLADGEPATAARLLAEALEEAPAANRPLIVAALQRLVEAHPVASVRGDEASAAIERALRARPPLADPERADLLQMHARLGSAESGDPAAQRASTALLDRALGDRAAPVRLAAIVELHRRGAPPPGLPDLDRTISQALAAPDALIRRAARRALRAWLVTASPDARWSEHLETLAAQLEQRADRADTAEILRDVARRHGAATRGAAKQAMRHVDDRDPRVRAAVLALAGHARLVEEGPRLVTALGAPDALEVAGARAGLVALGADATLPLLVGLEFGGAHRRSAVLAVLSELDVDADALVSLRDQQLGSIQESVLQRAAIESLPGGVAGLLRRRLEERVTEGLGALIGLLAGLRDDPRLSELERRLRRARSDRERDLLVEAIEALLGRAEREAILPILEPGSWPDRGAAIASLLGSRVEDAERTCEALRSSPDRTVRLLVRALSLEPEGAIGDPGSMRSTMEIAVRLQDAPVFDRLAMQQLIAVAELVQQQTVTAGERIYAAGEEGLALYLVLEGEVELRRGSKAVEVVGPGLLFGELATLDGLPRSTDAWARTDASVVRLDRDDLLRLLDEVPGLSMGLVQLLSARVRRLEERVDDDEDESMGEAS